MAMAWIDYKKTYDIVPQSWIIKCPKMYKISGEVIKFIGNTMENWSGELTTGGKNLGEGKSTESYYYLEQGKCLWVTYLGNTQEKKINHLMYMDHIKLFAKNEKIGNTNAGSEDI